MKVISTGFEEMREATVDVFVLAFIEKDGSNKSNLQVFLSLFSRSGNVDSVRAILSPAEARELGEKLIGEALEAELAGSQ